MHQLNNNQMVAVPLPRHSNSSRHRHSIITNTTTLRRTFREPSLRHTH